MGGVEKDQDDASEAGSVDIEAESSEDEEDDEEGEEEIEGEQDEDMEMDAPVDEGGNAVHPQHIKTDVMVH